MFVSGKAGRFPRFGHLGGLISFFVALGFAFASAHAQFFNDWAATNLNTVPLQSGPLDDPDNDGAPNLAEFAFGTDPLQPTGLGNAIQALVTGSNGLYAVQLLELAGHVPGVEINVDASIDVTNWIRPWWFRTVTNSLPTDPPGSVRESLTTLLPGTNLFFVRGNIELLLAGPQTATYFVATNGSDTASGTSIGAPFRSVAKAVSVANPGNLIYVRGGAYTTNATISISRNGSAASPIRLYAYPGEHPILDFSPQAFSSSNRGINMSASWWHVYGFEVENAGDNGMNVSGSSNIIELCSFHNCSDTGLQLSHPASSNLVLNCDGYHNCDGPTDGENADGIDAKLAGLGPDNVLSGCRAWENCDDGFDLFAAPFPVVITNCWSFDNGTNLLNIVNFAGDGNGFKLGGGNIGAANRIYNSLAFGNPQNGFDQNDNQDGLTVDQNTSWANGGENFDLNHNTETSVVHIVRNNLSIAGGKADSFTSGSILVSNSWQVISSPPAGTSDVISIDTSFATAPRRDDGSLPEIPLMRPVPNGRLVDKGANIGLPFSGTAPDLGAFESPAWPQ
ncbi:MAG TPA: right-handed parallel beta-helix repeat-containing protein [Verrucomicrobiae bacterium]|nr:right-handed parallel beta-helix repeat-containing protein [Verrucomicrobiae bacterium]